MIQRRLGKAVAVTALLFAACFLVVLGVLVFEEPGGPSLGGNRVAVVAVEGMIVDSERVVRELDRQVEDPSVRAIVVRIQSPGGVVAPTQEIYQAIGRVREHAKPVVASMGAVAASGGYYLAAAADRIVANPGTLTGSIGVIMQLAELQELFKKVGVRYEVIKSGRYKDVGNPSRPMSADERAILQALLDDMYDQFVGAVASGRHLDRQAVLAIADGRVYSGRRAKELGLVDQLGGLDDAIRLAGELAGIQGKPRVIHPRRPFRLAAWLEWLVGGTALDGLRGASATLPGLAVLGASKLPLYLMD
jgi:protease-4